MQISVVQAKNVDSDGQDEVTFRRTTTDRHTRTSALNITLLYVLPRTNTITERKNKERCSSRISEEKRLKILKIPKIRIFLCKLLRQNGKTGSSFYFM